MKKLRTSRRQFLQLAAGAGVATTALDGLTKTAATPTGATPTGAAPTAAASPTAPAGVGPVIGDDRIHIEFDPEMRMRVSGAAKAALTDWSAAESLQLGPDSCLNRFQLKSQSRQDMQGPLGRAPDCNSWA